MARNIDNSWTAATPPTGKTITNYSLENNGVEVIEVGNVLVANGVTINDDLEINTRVRAKYNDLTYGPYSNVETIAAVPSLLLDLYPGAIGAWSLQPLSSTTTNVVNVKETGGSTSADFTASEVADGTLTTFTGANDGIVNTWYDQSGNANNLTQAVDLRKPSIVIGGSLVTSNAIPALDFDTAHLSSAAQLIPTDLWTIFAAFEIESIGTADAVVNQATGDPDVGRTVFVTLGSATPTAATFFNNGASQNALYSTSWAVGQQLIASIGKDDGSYKFQKSGGALETILTGQALTPFNTSFNLGGYSVNNAAGDFNGKIKEVIVYASDQEANAAAILANMAARY